MATKKTGSTRRHFLGLTAAAAGKLTAAAVVVTSVVPPSTAKALGAGWWKKPGDRGNGGPQCFLRGTLIQTPTGSVAIETLGIGDPILTASGQSMPVKWVGRRSYKRSGASWPQTIVPVKIAAHALADNIPSRDLYVSPGHALLIDGVLIKAIDLVNDVTITRALPVDGGAIEYLHVALDSHEAIVAEGAATETLLLEPGVHEHYTNAAEFARLYPTEVTASMARFAPSVGYGGRLHMKALMRAAFGRFVPATARAERIYEKIADRAA